VRDQDRRWFFLIDNILIYKGMGTSEKNILSKFELIHNIMNQEYKTDKYLEICPLQIKKLFLYKDIKTLVNDFIPNLSYKCKGLIFYTLNTKNSNYAYLLPRDCQIEIKPSSEIEDLINEKYPDLLKNKNGNNSSNIDINTYNNNLNNNLNNTITNTSQLITDSENISQTTVQSQNISENNIILNNSNSNNISIIEENNVVFKILKTDIPDIYNLYCLDENNNLIKNSISLIPNIKISHLLYNAFLINPNNFDMNIECRYSKIFEKWIPINFVKNSPYNKKVILDIEEILKKY
jgi:hypothetical protein